jgi:hypothetical protein
MFRIKLKCVVFTTFWIGVYRACVSAPVSQVGVFITVSHSSSNPGPDVRYLSTSFHCEFDTFSVATLVGNFSTISNLTFSETFNFCWLTRTRWSVASPVIWIAIVLVSLDCWADTLWQMHAARVLHSYCVYMVNVFLWIPTLFHGQWNWYWLETILFGIFWYMLAHVQMTSIVKCVRFDRTISSMPLCFHNKFRERT